MRNKKPGERILKYLKDTKDKIEADGQIATIDEAIVRLEEEMEAIEAMIAHEMDDAREVLSEMESGDDPKE